MTEAGQFPKEIIKAAEILSTKTSIKPQIAIILGSGLGKLVDKIENKTTVPYENIPGFMKPTVEGHEGKVIFGKIHGKSIIALQGRFHYYEGYSMNQVVLPTRVAAALGVHTIIITNAAGGVNLNFKAGDLMIIKDHINQMGDNPLLGKEAALFGPRFPDMSEAYCSHCIQLLEETAKKLGISVQKGVYMANSGPTYETPAEVKMARILGADAVGMSTVPETIAARHMGLRVVGISCITNLAAGIGDKELSHEDVKETAAKVVDQFSRLITQFIANS